MLVSMLLHICNAARPAYLGHLCLQSCSKSVRCRMTGPAFFQGRCQPARQERSDQLGRARACSQAPGGAIVPHLPKLSSPLEQRVCPRRLVPLVRPPKLKPAFRPARQSASLGIQCMHANPWMPAHSTQSRDEPDNRRVEDTFQVHEAAGAIGETVTGQGSSSTNSHFGPHTA